MHEKEDRLEREIAERFAELWRLLDPVHGSGSVEFRAMACNQIISALERGMPLSCLPVEPASFSNTFRSEQMIARGQTTELYRVRHRDLDSAHVLKIPGRDWASDPIVQKQLIAEARVGLSLSHPNLAKTEVLLALEDGRRAILIELCGIPLSEKLRAGNLDAAQAVQALIDLLAGLQYLHECGYVHGDIAAENLFSPLSPGAGWKLGDFGLTVAASTTLAESGFAFAGRAALSSPEQIAGRALTPRSDLYSVGRLAGQIAARLAQSSASVAQALLAFEALSAVEEPETRPSSAAACQSLLRSHLGAAISACHR